ARSVVITGRKIVDHPLVRSVRIAEHSNNELTIVNAVFPFIYEKPGQARSRIRNIAHFLVNSKAGGTESRRVGAVKPGVHGNTAYARRPLPFIGTGIGFDPRFVSRALPDASTVSAVGP